MFRVLFVLSLPEPLALGPLLVSMTPPAVSSQPGMLILLWPRCLANAKIVHMVVWKNSSIFDWLGPQCSGIKWICSCQTVTLSSDRQVRQLTRKSVEGWSDSEQKWKRFENVLRCFEVELKHSRWPWVTLLEFMQAKASEPVWDFWGFLLDFVNCHGLSRIVTVTLCPFEALNSTAAPICQETVFQRRTYSADFSSQ